MKLSRKDRLRYQLRYFLVSTTARVDYVNGRKIISIQSESSHPMVYDRIYVNRKSASRACKKLNFEFDYRAYSVMDEHELQVLKIMNL